MENQNNSELPIVILKVAQTLDGKITTSTGQSKWITNEESRLLAHKLRLECDAILVGSTTVINDNPILNIRIGDNTKYIWRVIVNSKEKLPLDLNVFSDEHRKKTILFSTDKGAHKVRDSNLKAAGVNLHKLTTKKHEFDLHELLKTLKSQYNINKVLVEGGAKTLSTFIEQNLFNELHVFIAPKIFGEGKSSFQGFDAKSLANSPKLKLLETKIIRDRTGLEDNIYIILQNHSI